MIRLFIVTSSFLLISCTHIGAADGNNCGFPAICSVHIMNLTTDGGTIYLSSHDAQESDVTYLANANCNLRGLGIANVSAPYKVLSNGVKHFKYQCVAQQQIPVKAYEAPNIQQSYEPPQPQVPIEEAPRSQAFSKETAKKQCEALGFKPKTEKFGKCVLELTK
jgi:hypothetical protein